MSLFDTIIVQPIFNLLMGIYSLIPGGDFGLALIIFTILVRFLLWPLLKKQLHQAKAMRKMQPELVAIKKECNGNKQLEGIKMMELYKKHDISPFRSIGILFIQLPIFIALYEVIRIFTTNRGALTKYTYDFMEGIGPIKNLIENPDQFNQKLFGFLDLTKQAISSNNIDIFLLCLAILAAITQYIMSKQISPTQNTTRKLRDIMNEAADGKQADQSEMNAVVTNSMMKFLPIMMFFMMISLPGALALYYTMSNIVAVIQQHSILKDDMDEMIAIADEVTVIDQHKKATIKARVKQAKEANITRIVAKDTKPNYKKEKV